jgi:hypothetical protein
MKSGRRIYGGLVSGDLLARPADIAKLKRGELVSLILFLTPEAESALRDELLALAMCEVVAREISRFRKTQKRKARKVL